MLPDTFLKDTCTESFKKTIRSSKSGEGVGYLAVRPPNPKSGGTCYPHPRDDILNRLDDCQVTSLQQTCSTFTRLLLDFDIPVTVSKYL